MPNQFITISGNSEDSEDSASDLHLQCLYCGISSSDVSIRNFPSADSRFAENNRPFCTDCFHQHYHCQGCGRMHSIPREDRPIRTTPDGHLLCEHCASFQIRQCSICHAVGWRTDYTFTEDGNLCQACRTSNYHDPDPTLQCLNCGVFSTDVIIRIFPSPNVRYAGNSGALCTDCFHQHYHCQGCGRLDAYRQSNRWLRTDPDGRLLCGVCAADHIRRCFFCGIVGWSADHISTQDGGVCQSCWISNYRLCPVEAEHGRILINGECEVCRSQEEESDEAEIMDRSANVLESGNSEDSEDLTFGMPIQCTYCGRSSQDVILRNFPSTHAGFAENNSLLCTSCFNQHYRCQNCGRLDAFLQNNIHRRTTPDGQLLCRRCAFDQIRRCAICNLVGWTGDYTLTDDGDVCQSCLTSNYRLCEVGVEHGYFRPERAGECETCRAEEYERRNEYDDDDSDEGEIMDHSANVLEFCRIDRERLKKELLFGVELEVESKEDRYSDAARTKRLVGSFAITKGDGSLANGFEIVSLPMSISEHYQAWEKFFENRPPSLRSHDTNTCGMHVHVSRQTGYKKQWRRGRLRRKPKDGKEQDLRVSELQAIKMAAFLNERNEEIDSFIKLIAQRDRDNSYCALKKQSKLSDYSYEENRYHPVNFCNSSTIEIRIFRGTLEKTSFFKNLEFCAALVEWTREAALTQLTVGNFLRFLDKRRKDYPNLVNFLAEKKVIERRITKANMTSEEKKALEALMLKKKNNNP